MGPMTQQFRVVAPYLNPKNRGMPRPEVLAEAARKEREYQIKKALERKATTPELQKAVAQAAEALDRGRVTRLGSGRTAPVA